MLLICEHTIQVLCSETPFRDMAESSPNWCIPELSCLPPLPPSPYSFTSSVIPAELCPSPLFSNFHRDIEHQHARYVAGRSGGIFEENPESSTPFDYRYVRHPRPSEYSASLYSQPGVSDSALMRASHQNLTERVGESKPRVLEAIAEVTPRSTRNTSGNSKETGTTDDSFYSEESTRAQLGPTGNTPRRRKQHRPFTATISKVASSLSEKLHISKRRAPISTRYRGPPNRSEEIAYCSRVVSQMRSRAETARRGSGPSLLQTSQWKSSHPPMQFTLPPADFSVSPIKLSPITHTRPHSNSPPNLPFQDISISYPTQSAQKTPSPAKTSATTMTATSNVTSTRSIPTQHTPSTLDRAEVYETDRANAAFFEVPRQQEERRESREMRNKERQEGKMTGDDREDREPEWWVAE